MKALIAFESVVRLGSVTKAAKELFVTHGAVSKQIAALEDWAGQPLFHDNRKLMQPTESGLALAKSADRAFDLIAAASAGLRPAEEAAVLKVLAPSTFAMRWLIPRVWSFSEQHRRIAVQVRPTDSLEAWLDIPFDVAIRTDPRAPGHLTTSPFLSETLILAIAPKSPLRSDLRGPTDLAGKRLVAAATRPGQLEAWLEAAGLPTPPADGVVSFPHFYLALEAALAGLGPLVCPLETLSDLLTKGELIELWPEIRVAGPTYAAVYDEASPQKAAARTFVEWLRTF